MDLIEEPTFGGDKSFATSFEGETYAYFTFLLVLEQGDWDIGEDLEPAFLGAAIGEGEGVSLGGVGFEEPLSSILWQQYVSSS